MANRLQNFDRETALYLQDLRGDARREVIREAALDLFGEARAQNIRALGYRPDEIRSTDNVLNKPPEQMAIGGWSQVEFDLHSDVIAFSAELAKRLSPRSGSNRKAPQQTYAENHLVIVDGAVVPPPYRVDKFERAVIINLLPYARKIERGLSKKRPNGIYEALLVPEVKKRYGGQFFITFTYLGGYVEKFGKRSYLQTAVTGADGRLKRRRRVRKIVDRDRLPALVIEA